MIIFVHIPKTAGALVRDKIFRKNCDVLTSREIAKKYIPKTYLSEYLYGNKTIPAKPDGLVGHIPHGIHKILDIEESEISYFTFLRDPIERWLSNFYYFQNEFYVRKPWNEYTRLFKEANSDLKCFLKICLKEGWSQNSMIRQLSGAEDIREIEKRGLKRRNDQLQKPFPGAFLLALQEYLTRLSLSLFYTKSFHTATKTYTTDKKIQQDRNGKPKTTKLSSLLNNIQTNLLSRSRGYDDVMLDVYGYHLQTKTYSDNEYQGFLEAAKKNIKQYTFVGFNDRLEEDTKKLCQLYNWPYDKSTLNAYNKTQYFRLKKLVLDDETKELLYRINKYDILFYKWCKENIHSA